VEVGGNPNSHYPCKTQQAQNYGVPNEELRPLNLRIDECCNKTSAICDGELRPGGGCAHIVAGGVITDPAKDAGDTGIEAGGHQERHPVLNFIRIDVGDHCIANDGQREGSKHDWTTKAKVVGEEGYADLEVLGKQWVAGKELERGLPVMTAATA
jgi:hypothetical protein